MKIAMIYQNIPAFDIHTHKEKGLGGSENGFLNTVRYLVKQGHQVHVFNRLETVRIDYGGGLLWSNIAQFDPKEYFDVVYSLRHREPFQQDLNTKLKVLFLADTESVGLGEDIRAGRIDLVISVSHWQKEKIAKEEEIHDDHWLVSSNGVEVIDLPLVTKVPGRCIFMATPERGLDNLLTVWPKIKSQVPFASLHLYSSFMGWGHTAEENEEMVRGIYTKVESLRDLDVVNFKHANSEIARDAQRQADLYLYPSDFYETCGMAILESMLWGTIPVVSGRAALLEKVLNKVTGYVVPTYGSSNQRYQDKFVEQTVRALLLNEETKKRMRLNCQTYAMQFSYDNLVTEWTSEWQRRIAN